MTYFLDDYYCTDDQAIYFSKQQGSHFAKQIADDFNPLHDPDNKLFCIPGDLLFSLTLHRYGLHEQMRFAFTGMVSEGLKLYFKETESQKLAVVDEAEKPYLKLDHAGASTTTSETLEQFSRAYVAFSGHNFPDLLVPLMADNQVMINPKRPIAIYDSMEIHIDDINAVTAPSLKFNTGHLEVKGKKGDVRLEFDILSNDQQVGTGTKFMSLRGLLPYDQDVVDSMVTEYDRHKQEFLVL